MEGRRSGAKEPESSRPPRFFSSDGTALAEGVLVPLAPDESRHVRSRRLRSGDRVLLLDGRGGRGEGPLDATCAAALVEKVTRDVGESSCRVTLLLGAAEPARIEWAIEKATECGVHRVLLVTCERSQAAHVSQLSGRLARLRKIAAEAVKQCDRSVIPEVESPVSLAEALRAAPRPLVLASPNGGPCKRTPLPGTAEMSIGIGPEGGFTDREEALFGEAGATLVTLGPRILRLETAVVVSLSRLVDLL